MKGGGDALSRDAVVAMTGLTLAEIDEKVRTGTFPAPLPLGPWAFGWSAADVRAWLAARGEVSRSSCRDL